MKDPKRRLENQKKPISKRRKRISTKPQNVETSTLSQNGHEDHETVTRILKESELVRQKKDEMQEYDSTIPENFKTVSAKNFQKFLRKLKTSPKQDAIQNCTNSVNANGHLGWKSSSNLLRALKDCLLRRKWKNLTHILRLITNNHVLFNAVWPKLCLILLKLHPTVDEHDLQDKLRFFYNHRLSKSYAF